MKKHKLNNIDIIDGTAGVGGNTITFSKILTMYMLQIYLNYILSY